jgi:hypothetical protein
LSLLIERFRPLGPGRFPFDAFLRYSDVVARNFNGGRRRHGLLAWLVAVGPWVLLAEIGFYVCSSLGFIFGLAFYLPLLPWIGGLVGSAPWIALSTLEACFPAGSITGAPKRRAMEAIRQIEGSPRGADYGSLFRAAADGEIDSSVLIRTATCRETPDGWAVTFRVG